MAGQAISGNSDKPGDPGKREQEALAKAEELGADKTAIIEYYSLQQKKILDEQAKATQAAATKKRKPWPHFRKPGLKRYSNSLLPDLTQLEREKQEALAQAEEMGADTTAILEYYAGGRAPPAGRDTG